MKRTVAVAIVLLAAAGAIGLGVSRGRDDEGARCGKGFVANGPWCEPDEGCPDPLVSTPRGCDAPDVTIAIPGGAIAMGASDWEAEGRVAPRSIRVQPFRIDAFEVTRGQLAALSSAAGVVDDLARAACDVSQSEARSACRARGGRLPTEDEWIMAAVSAMNPPRRYPWGDTGAVCRRAAWGLVTGPCAQGATGPDLVGAHPDGDSALGVHDLAGNVAEWVDGADSIAKGGSWATALAADLRIWARLPVPPGGRDPRVGFRCVYAP